MKGRAGRHPTSPSRPRAVSLHAATTGANTTVLEAVRFRPCWKRKNRSAGFRSPRALIEQHLRLRSLHVAEVFQYGRHIAVAELLHDGADRHSTLRERSRIGPAERMQRELP